MTYRDVPADRKDEPKILLSGEDAREAARLSKLLAAAIEMQTGPFANGTKAFGRNELILRAQVLLQARQMRLEYFNRAMFGEPAWDVLLALYATESSEGSQSIGRIAEWIQTPLTTVARWIDYLEKEKLVAREAHPNDRRVIFIRLLEKGRDLLDAYLANVPWHPGEAHTGS